MTLRLIVLLVMLVGGVSSRADSNSKSPTTNTEWVIMSKFPLGENVYCSGGYYVVVTLANGNNVIYRGSYSLSSGHEYTTLVLDYGEPIVYKTDGDWQKGITGYLANVFSGAKRVYIEMTSQYDNK